MTDPQDGRFGGTQTYFALSTYLERGPQAVLAASPPWRRLRQGRNQGAQVSSHPWVQKQSLLPSVSRTYAP